MLSDMKREAQMLYTGAATSDAELRDHPERVKRFLRATARGRAYYRAFRTETIDILDKYNGRPRAANEADYDDVIPSMTEDGSMPVEIQQRDTAIRAEINGLDRVPPVEWIYDYRITREVHRELRASNWQPSR